MNLVTLSGYIRKKNLIKRTRKDEDSLTFTLEFIQDGTKQKIQCTVFNRLVRRVNKAVSVDDKVLVHGYLKTFNKANMKTLVIVEKLELLDFVRYEDKNREDKKKTKQSILQESLERIGI